MPTKQLTADAFVRKWNGRFADNTFQLIKEGDFREFASDIATVFGVLLENVPEYAPGITYQKGFLVRYTPAGGTEAFYYSLKAGVLSAPGPSNTTDWKVVPGPTTATALSQDITLVQAQGIQFDQVVAGRTYLIDFGPDAQGYVQTVTVRGVSNNSFDVEGTLEVNGKITPVTAIDVFLGTYQVKGTSTGTGPAGSTYHEAKFNTSTDGVQTITPASSVQLAQLAQATDIMQVGLLAADGTLDPEFAPGTGYSFDLTTHKLIIFAGNTAPGDYIKRDNTLLIKWITGPISGPAVGTIYTAGAGIVISAQNEVSTSVKVGTGTVLKFTEASTYPTLLSGTFTVDTTGAAPGVVVFAELGPGVSQPSLPAQFELVGKDFTPGKRQGFAAQVMPSKQIEYFYYLKP